MVNKHPSQAGAPSRRQFIKQASVGAMAGLCSSMALAGSDRYQDGAAPVHYPDPDIIALDKRFSYRIGNAAIQRLHTGMRWAEGPAWNGVGRYLVWSDIPNNQQLRLTAENNHVSANFRSPSHFSNGNTFDLQGRQISCEHLERRVVRYETNGSVTVLAKAFDGKSLNAPNDVVVNPLDGSIWFTDPGYGSLGVYEGTNANNGSSQPYQKEAVYRIDGTTGAMTKVTDEVYKPNGLCFSQDYKKLYVADSGVSHYAKAVGEIKVWDVAGATLNKGRRFTLTEYKKQKGIVDGIRCDTDGNIWAGAGWAGRGYDGVHIFAPDGDRIGQIVLPEICSNLCFGGKHRNQLFMTASQSLYSVYVGAQGAHFC
ncbi:MAG TPA: SMP-30/gluconolactonase/LRE family protein [Marinagarivorans sp.]